MIRLKNHLGVINISEDYFSNLVGYAASNCFGVAGMTTSGAVQGIRSLFSKTESQDKGVRIKANSEGLVVELHIVVTYGVNIAAIVKSIVNKVSYTIEESTGLVVSKVNVFVDKMITE